MKKFFTLIAVAVMAIAAQANVLTVCDDGAQNAYAPIYGLYMDTQSTTCQMIYPAAMLEDMQDGKINELRFYARDAFNLGEGELQLKLMVVDQETFEPLETIEGATLVATGYPVAGETELVFAFDEPWEYTGGNLLVETYLEQPGKFATTYFYGMNTDYVASLYQYVWATWTGPSINGNRFLPKATFTYEEGEAPEPVEAPVITWVAEDGVLTITAIGEGFVMLEVGDDGITRTGEDEATYTMQYDPAEGVTINVRACIWAGEPVSEYATQTIVIEPVSPRSSVNEVAQGKTIASVRYFNMAGQEMQQASGMTIVVTSYTDGTTSAVKVMK